jgi:helicase MOV-10
MNNWQDIMIGSTEQFQGQERKIILISTVRSQVELLKEDFIFNLGFLQNPKRYISEFKYRSAQTWA